MEFEKKYAGLAVGEEGGPDAVFRVEVKRPCTKCYRLTNWVSPSFEGYFCSEECLNAMWEEYRLACFRSFVSAIREDSFTNRFETLDVYIDDAKGDPNDPLDSGTPVTIVTAKNKSDEAYIRDLARLLGEKLGKRLVEKPYYDEGVIILKWVDPEDHRADDVFKIVEKFGSNIGS